MARTHKFDTKKVMVMAWQLVKRNGYTMSEALKCAWANIKLKVAMTTQIVKFYFRKVDGSLREAYGTLSDTIIPTHTSESNRKSNDTIQVYFDTEKGEWRCYKIANLIRLA